MTLRPCGTHAAYYRHRLRGEPPCDDCRQAANRYERERHRRLGRQPRTPTECGTVAGRTAHVKRGEAPCEPCRLAYNEWQRTSRRVKAEGRVTIPSVIFDVLETAGISMGLRSLMAWVNELHPEWADNNVKRTLTRLVSEGRVERVEFGDEIRYRMP